MKLYKIITIFFVCCTFSCSHKNSRIRSNEYLITERGLPEIIEIGMDHSTFQQKGIEHCLKPEYVVAPLLKKIYTVPSLSVEYELKNYKIYRIWFFSKRTDSSPVLFRLNGSPGTLSSISSNDIISNFGTVNIFLNENPRKDENQPYWVKYDPFKVGINYIVYPDYPYLFYFDKNDMLSFITVSLENE